MNVKDEVKNIIKETCSQWLIADERELERVSKQLEEKITTLSGSVHPVIE